MEFVKKLAKRKIEKLESKKTLTEKEQGKLKAYKSDLNKLKENFKNLMLKEDKTTKEWAEFKTYKNFKEIINS